MSNPEPPDDFPTPDETAPEAQVEPSNVVPIDAKVVGPKLPAWRARITKKNGEIKCNVANLICFLVHEPLWEHLHAFNEFSQVIEVTRAPVWDEDFAPRKIADHEEWTEQDDVRLGAWFSRTHRIDPTPAQVRAAVDIVARRRAFNPLLRYVKSLTWDGVSRLEHWLATYLGVAPSPYASSVGTKMLIGGIARALRPGCKLDTMVVLEGHQGARKSTAIATLFGREWSTDTPPDLQSKDRFLGLRGRWGVEYPELDGMGKADTDRIKSFLSSAVDDYRPPYARSYIKVPRSCIIVGTVNGSEYLKDATGNRRFWPVRVGRIDIEALGADRDQLWAEALSLYENGRSWWPDETEAALYAAEQHDRMHFDEWYARLEEWSFRQPFVTVGDALSKELGIEPGKWGQSEQNRVARCLLQMGRTRMRERGTDARRWGYGTREYATKACPSVPVQQDLTGTGIPQ